MAQGDHRTAPNAPNAPNAAGATGATGAFALDPIALRAEIEPLHAACFGWAMACVGRRRDDAEDVLQATYVKVLSGRARYDGRAAFKTWLFGVIRLTAREHGRRRWLKLFGLGGESGDEPAREPAVETPSPEAAASRDERALAVARAVGRLTARQREVLHLVFYEDFTLREAADALGMSVGSASVHYDRGKKNLAALLRAEGVEP